MRIEKENKSLELIAQVTENLLLFFNANHNVLLFYFVIKMFFIECTCTHKLKILSSTHKQLCNVNSTLSNNSHSFKMVSYWYSLLFVALSINDMEGLIHKIVV